MAEYQTHLSWRRSEKGGFLFSLPRNFQEKERENKEEKKAWYSGYNWARCTMRTAIT